MAVRVTVLCEYKDHRRSVSFSRPVGHDGSDLNQLKESIRMVFCDLIPEDLNLLLQIESAEWGGKLVDIQEHDSVPDRSFIHILPAHSSCLVSTTVILYNNVHTIYYQLRKVMVKLLQIV